MVKLQTHTHVAILRPFFFFFLEEVQRSWARSKHSHRHEARITRAKRTVHVSYFVTFISFPITLSLSIYIYMDRYISIWLSGVWLAYLVRVWVAACESRAVSCGQ